MCIYVHRSSTLFVAVYRAPIDFFLMALAIAQVLIIDEIGTAQEVRSVKSIAQRGVAMVATAHGVRLESMLKNPELNPLLGGLEQVTLGDQAARCAFTGNSC